jgi:hypothetical protein
MYYILDRYDEQISNRSPLVMSRRNFSLGWRFLDANWGYTTDEGSREKKIF